MAGNTAKWLEAYRTSTSAAVQHIIFHSTRREHHKTRVRPRKRRDKDRFVLAIGAMATRGSTRWAAPTSLLNVCAIYKNVSEILMPHLEALQPPYIVHARHMLAITAIQQIETDGIPSFQPERGKSQCYSTIYEPDPWCGKIKQNVKHLRVPLVCMPPRLVPR